MSQAIIETDKGVDITLTRGDTLFLPLLLKKGDDVYIPAEGSSIRFAMKEKYKDPDEAVLIVKSIPIDTLLLELEPEDTKPLEMKKTYVYDIELTDEAGHVDTFMSGKFTIGEEVM